MVELLTSTGRWERSCRGLIVDQDLDSLLLGLVVQTLRGEERKVVDAGVQIDGLADAGVVLEEGHLGAAGGLGIADREGAAIAAHAGDPRELPGRTGRGNLYVVPELVARRGGASW